MLDEEWSIGSLEQDTEARADEILSEKYKASWEAVRVDEEEEGRWPVKEFKMDQRALGNFEKDFRRDL